MNDAIKKFKQLEFPTEDELEKPPEMSGNNRCAESIRKEKLEAERKYGIRILQTDIICAVCNRPWGFGRPACTPQPEVFIPIDVDKSKWIEAAKELKAEYGITEGGKQDPQSSKRIAILVGEHYLSNYGKLKTGKGIFHNPPLLNVMIIEREIFDMAMENRLTCEPLEEESRVKNPKRRMNVLDVWGVDKKSGFENYRTQLAEWTAEALVVAETKTEGKEDREDVEHRFTPSRDDYRDRVDETFRHETERIEIFAGRKRDAVRQVEHEETSLS